MQFMTGYGCLQSYMYRIGKTEFPGCIYCNEEDSVEHIFFVCEKWMEERVNIDITLMVKLRVENVIEKMIESEEKRGSCRVRGERGRVKSK